MSSDRFPARGTGLRPPNRFATIHVEPDPEPREAVPKAPTIYLRDASRRVLAENASPDVPFRFSLNPYRGCEHGCPYCYARPSHQHLGFDAGLDFETRIVVKDRAPELLRRELLAPSWRPQVVALSGNTDCYQPIERRLRLTRRCLEVFLELRNPVSVITKSALVARDADLLGALAHFRAAQVSVSLTTLDPALARQLEPRASSPARRLEAIATLARAGVPTAATVAPVVPGLNDAEIPSLLEAAAAAGARSASWTLLRLPPPLDAVFDDWLARSLPERRAKVLARLSECRGGGLSSARVGERMRGRGEYAAQIARLFSVSARRHGLADPLPPLDGSAFLHPGRPGEQLPLF